MARVFNSICYEMSFMRVLLILVTVLLFLECSLCYQIIFQNELDEIKSVKNVTAKNETDKAPNIENKNIFNVDCNEGFRSFRGKCTEILLSGAMWTTMALLYLYLAMGNGIVTLKEMHQYVLKMPDLSTICQNLNSSDPAIINKICIQQLKIVCSNVTLFMTMLDASSKYPYTGMGYGSQQDIGNFDQCLDIDHTENGTRILGEHCTEGLAVPDFFGDPFHPRDYSILAVCRPDGCNAADYNWLALQSVKFDFPEAFLDDNCQTVNSKKAFGTMDAITLGIFGIIISLMILSTILHSQNKNFQNNYPVLLAFSVTSNCKKLFRMSKHNASKEQIEVLQGLRVISMMWIVAGHGFMAWDNVPVSNRSKYGITWTDFIYAGYINTAPLAVDTFFYIAGFLTAFQYMKHKKKSLISQLIYVPVMFIHRYLRLTPAMLMVYLVVISIFVHLGNGPLWNRNEYVVQNCKEQWWAVFLYVQNYNNYDNVCMPPTWFLSAVMQMFIISPVVLIPISFILRRPSGVKYSMIGLCVLNMLFIVLPMAHKIIYNTYKNEYDAHSRLIDYFIGVMLGIFMRENIGKPFLHMVKDHRKSKVNILMWCLTIILMLAMVVCYQLAHIKNKDDNKFIFHSLMRPVWCMGLSWIIYSCHNGYGGFIEWILCRPVYQVLGRLTYTIYLVHEPVIDYHTFTTQTTWYFTDYNAFYLFCGNYTVSVTIAIFWTLSFESPLLIIEKYLIRKCSKTVREESISSQTAYFKKSVRQRHVQNGIADVECGEMYAKHSRHF